MYLLIFQAWAYLFGFGAKAAGLQYVASWNDVSLLKSSGETFAITSNSQPQLWQGLANFSGDFYASVSGAVIRNDAAINALQGCHIMTHISMWLIAAVIVVFIYSLFRFVSRCFGGRR